MQDLYESRNSIYCYEGTNVLINRKNIKELDKLEEYDDFVSTIKLSELFMQGITGDFNIIHFTNIHRYLFENLYQFAGLFRTENIAKGDFRFAEWEYIEPELKKLLDSLAKENYLNGLSKEDLSKKLAYYMAELNVLHPFRER